MTLLSKLGVLVLDAQATSADPKRGALVEIGWARFSAEEARELLAAEVTAHVVAPPPAAVMPPAVTRLTGLRAADWARGRAPASVWADLRLEGQRVSSPPGPAPTVVHFARFEEPFLRALHTRHGTGPFPLDLLCTHAIARRLLPDLPRRTLRALAGYFGAAVPRLRRSADHVVATAFVWRHLLALLGEREGVRERADLEDWLQRPARRCARRFPLPRERRLELPDHPGVYRLLRAGGAVLYVGKASSLRQRVGGHFHAHAGRGERALEMLTQVREVSFTETETALEAALLEADEIKRLAPPFNVALAADGRQVRFATADLQETGERPDAVHVVGPLISPGPFGGLSALRALLAAGGPCAPGASARARAVGVEPVYAPAAGCFRSGFARFVGEHGPLKCPRDLLQLGARLWSRRLATAATGPEPGSEEGGEEETRASRRPAWTDERVVQALEETVLRAAHAVRRARWLTRLSECSLAWAEPGWERPRLLVIRGGTVTARGYLEPGVPVPPPPGHARTTAERRTSFDLSVFDRLRVLTTELRGLTAGAASLELRLGPSARLSRKRLQSVLRWV